MADSDELSGALFPHDKRGQKSEKGNDYPYAHGPCTIGNKKYQIAAWTFQPKGGKYSGQTCLSLKFEAEDAQQQTQAAEAPEDVPF